MLFPAIETNKMLNTGKLNVVHIFEDLNSKNTFF